MLVWLLLVVQGLFDLLPLFIAFPPPVLSLQKTASASLNEVAGKEHSALCKCFHCLDGTLCCCKPKAGTSSDPTSLTPACDAPEDAKLVALSLSRIASACLSESMRFALAPEQDVLTLVVTLVSRSPRPAQHPPSSSLLLL